MVQRTPKSVPALVDYIAQVTGDPESTLGHIARRIRESGAGKISQKGHGRGAAKATTRDAATILLVSMATDKAIHAGVAADALADYRLQEYEDDDGSQKIHETILGLDMKARDPIGVVTEIIDAMRAIDPNLRNFHSLTVYHGGASVCIVPEDRNEGVYDFSPMRETRAVKRLSELKQRSSRASDSRAWALRRTTEFEQWGLKDIADWLEGRETE